MYSVEREYCPILATREEGANLSEGGQCPPLALPRIMYYMYMYVCLLYMIYMMYTILDIDQVHTCIHAYGKVRCISSGFL